MTKVKIKRIKGRSKFDNMINGFDVEGHSGYAEAGRDIVCAAISAITQATIMGLMYVIGIGCHCSSDANKGSLHCKIYGGRYYDFRKAQILFDTMKIAIEDIVDQYPDYVSMEDDGDGD